MAQNKPAFIQRATNWLHDIANDSVKKAITDIVAKFLTLLFIAVTTIVLASVSTTLQSTIIIPLYVVLVLSLFALVGVLVPISKILDKMKQVKLMPKDILARISFEEGIPRAWVARCSFNGLQWYYNSFGVDVYCTRHNLKLVTGRMTRKNKDWVISSCSDCKREQINYYPEINDTFYGIAFHCEVASEKTFFTDLKNRLVREASDQASKGR